MAAIPEKEEATAVKVDRGGASSVLQEKGVLSVQMREEVTQMAREEASEVTQSREDRDSEAVLSTERTGEDSREKAERTSASLHARLP